MLTLFDYIAERHLIEKSNELPVKRQTIARNKRKLEENGESAGILLKNCEKLIFGDKQIFRSRSQDNQMVH